MGLGRAGCYWRGLISYCVCGCKEGESQRVMHFVLPFGSWGIDVLFAWCGKDR